MQSLLLGKKFQYEEFNYVSKLNLFALKHVFVEL